MACLAGERYVFGMKWQIEREIVGDAVFENFGILREKRDGFIETGQGARLAVDPNPYFSSNRPVSTVCWG